MEAIGYLESMDEQLRTAVPYQYLLGISHLQAGNCGAALLSLRTAENKGEGDRQEVMYLVGRALLASEKYDEAHDQFLKVSTTFPDTQYGKLAARIAQRLSQSAHSGGRFTETWALSRELCGARSGLVECT